MATAKKQIFQWTKQSTDTKKLAKVFFSGLGIIRLILLENSNLFNLGVIYRLNLLAYGSK